MGRLPLSAHIVGASVMVTSSLAQSEVDFIEELKLRRWARENYVPADKRDRHWHPIVLEEMTHKDKETQVNVLAG